MKKSRSQSSGRASGSKSASSGSRSASSGGSKKSASSKSSSGGRSASASGGRASSSGGRGSSSKSAPRSASKSSTNGRATASKSTASKKTASKKTATKRTATASRASSNGRASASRGRAKQLSPREGLTEVLKDGLKDIYYAEKQLVKALKKLSKTATNQELKQAFTTHMEQTVEQVEKLEEAFEAMEMRASGKKCPAMDGLIEEANEHIEEMDKGPALDAALIVGAQKVEHYEIAAYGSMRTFARMLGYSECERIFDEILQQESETDELLNQIAETVNREALEGEEGSGNGASRQAVEMGEMEEEQM